MEDSEQEKYNFYRIVLTNVFLTDRTSKNLAIFRYCNIAPPSYHHCNRKKKVLLFEKIRLKRARMHVENEPKDIDVREVATRRRTNPVVLWPGGFGMHGSKGKSIAAKMRQSMQRARKRWTRQKHEGFCEDSIVTSCMSCSVSVVHGHARAHTRYTCTHSHLGSLWARCEGKLYVCVLSAEARGSGSRIEEVRARGTLPSTCRCYPRVSASLF